MFMLYPCRKKCHNKIGKQQALSYNFLTTEVWFLPPMNLQKTVGWILVHTCITIIYTFCVSVSPAKVVSVACAINPWRGCAARVKILILCVYVPVCLSVPTLAKVSHSDKDMYSISIGFTWLDFREKSCLKNGVRRYSSLSLGYIPR